LCCQVVLGQALNGLKIARCNLLNAMRRVTAYSNAFLDLVYAYASEHEVPGQLSIWHIKACGGATFLQVPFLSVMVHIVMCQVQQLLWRVVN
jgi:hypothetical protein